VKYSRFEMLALAVGATAILGTVMAAWHSQPVVQEVVAQVLLLGVLAGAVHWGRGGGFAAAIVAIVAYIAMRAPLLARDGLTPDLLDLILVRTLTYGFVGIIGGEVCGRVKYLLARLNSALNVDEETQLYNQRFVLRILQASIGQHTRYGAPFSIVLVELSPALTSELRPSRRRSILKTVANHVRGDVRLVDDVGRLDDGRFLLVLPHTPTDGAAIAAERVRTGVRDLLGARDESVETRVLGAPDDLRELQDLVDSLTPPEPATSGEEREPATA
jgi:GGDEF domain-containing protein